jgi:chaperonin GroEL (HSP60 family)
MSNLFTNVVPKESLRRAQLETMEALKDYLSKSFGPYGSNTIINKENGLPRYTKDGHTILKSIQVSGEIERAVLSDIEEETRTQAIKIGDSTTSITILSAIIFKALSEYEKNHPDKTPAQIVKTFKNVTEEICEEIKKHGRETTVDDVYNIALISTNGDEKLAKMLKDIYEEFGLDVYIDVKASMNGTTYLKEINGMTMDCGFLDPTLINDPGKNACVISNPRIYAFKDPIDTMEMGAFLDAILYKNIIKPIKDQDVESMVPTVIMAPRISRDYSAFMDQLMQSMASAPAANRGWLNIITDIQSCDMEQFEDICDLCGCKYIKKYLDPEIQKEDIEKGYAPTPETINNFSGTADKVISDANKTTFINPLNMYKEDGSNSLLLDQRLDYLERQIKRLEVEGNNTTDIYTLKKRLNSLKGKMVEIYIGGVTVADRDAERDLLEDAVLNCRSAALNGVGYAANFEGLRASNEVFYKYAEEPESDENIISGIIFNAYDEITRLLYSTIPNKDEYDLDKMILDSLTVKYCPYNISTNEYDGKVLTSIDTDICTLTTISKIITIMATANQFILSTLNVNKY